MQRSKLTIKTETKETVSLGKRPIVTRNYQISIEAKQESENSINWNPIGWFLAAFLWVWRFIAYLVPSLIQFLTGKS